MIEIKRILESVDLGAYHEAYTGQTVHVWVNLPRELRREREWLMGNYMREVIKGLKPGFIVNDRLVNWARQGLLRRRNFRWLAMLWSQHEDASTHWNVWEIRKLFTQDPNLYMWLMHESALRIDAFQARKKKL